MQVVLERKSEGSPQNVCTDAKVRGSWKVIGIQRLGMNVCSKFHGNPSNSSWDISIKNKNDNSMVALEEKAENPQSQ